MLQKRSFAKDCCHKYMTNQEVTDQKQACFWSEGSRKTQCSCSSHKCNSKPEQDLTRCPNIPDIVLALSLCKGLGWCSSISDHRA